MTTLRLPIVRQLIHFPSIALWPVSINTKLSVSSEYGHDGYLFGQNDKKGGNF